MVPPSSASASNVEGRRILLVDDDRINLRILAGILKKEGYVAAEANSGERALELYLEFRPHLVLLDVVMAGIDGLETCRRLKRAHGERCAPIIFITAKNDSEDVVEGLAAGGVDYLPKPFQPKEVAARIKTHLQIQLLAAQQLSLVEQLRNANVAKNRFLGMAAHDLRNPLASIRGISEFLLAGAVGPLTPDQLDLVDTIQTTSQGMLQMVNELLDVATIEAGELKLIPQLGSLDELVNKCVTLANMEASKKNTKIALEAGGGRVTLSFDAAKMKQVVDNLLSNSVKFSPPGSIITVLVRRETATPHVSFAVRDQGPGIPHDERDKLFKDFGRLSVQPTGGEKSTGLGLAICRKIVEAHGGTIVAENLPDRGCEFRVTLPSPQ